MINRIVIFLFLSVFFTNDSSLFAENKFRVHCYEQGDKDCKLEKKSAVGYYKAEIDDYGNICFQPNCHNSSPLSFNIDTTKISERLTGNIDIGQIQHDFTVDYMFNKTQRLGNETDIIFGMQKQSVIASNYKDIRFMLKINLEKLRFSSEKKSFLKLHIKESFSMKSSKFTGSKYWADYKPKIINSDVIMYGGKRQYIQNYYYYYVFKLKDIAGVKTLVYEEDEIKPLENEANDSTRVNVQLNIEDDNSITLTNIIKNNLISNFKEARTKNEYYFFVPLDQTSNVKSHLSSHIKEVYKEYIHIKFDQDHQAYIIKNKKLYITIPSNARPCNNIIRSAIYILSEPFTVCDEHQKNETNPPRELKFSTLQKLQDHNYKDQINMDLNMYGMAYKEISNNDEREYIELKLQKIKPNIYIRVAQDIKRNFIFSYNKNYSRYNDRIKMHIIECTTIACKWPKPEKILSNNQYKITHDESNKTYFATPKPKYVQFKLMNNDLDPTKIFQEKNVKEKKTCFECNNVHGATDLIKCQTEINSLYFTSDLNPNLFINKNFKYYLSIDYSYDNKWITLNSRKLMVKNPGNFIDYIQIEDKKFSSGGFAQMISLDGFIKITSNKFLKKYGLQKDTITFSKDKSYIILETKPLEQRTITLTLHSNDSNDINTFNTQTFKYISTGQSIISRNDNTNFKKKYIDIPFLGEIKKNLFEPQNIFLYDFDANLDVIVTSNALRKNYSINFFRKELSEEKKPGVILRNTPDFMLDGINKIKPTANKMRNVSLLVPKTIKNIDQFFSEQLKPKSHFGYLNSKGDVINVLLKDPNQHILVILYPITYRNAYRSYFSYKTEGMKLRILNDELIYLIQNIESTKYYKDIFLGVTDENLKSEKNIKKFKRVEAIGLINDPPDKNNDDNFPWTESQNFEIFKGLTSSSIDIIYFSAFTEPKNIKDIFKDLDMSKVYLINFTFKKVKTEDVTTEVEKGKRNKNKLDKRIRIKNILEKDFKRLDYESIKDYVIDQNDILKFFKIN